MARVAALLVPILLAAGDSGRPPPDCPPQAADADRAAELLRGMARVQERLERHDLSRAPERFVRRRRPQVDLAIHRSCERFAGSIVAAFESVVSREIECLSDLGGSKARTMAADIRSVLANTAGLGKPVTVGCTEEMGGYADASVPGTIGHPHLELRVQNGQLAGQRSIFHELIHFSGARHDGTTSEDAYACQFCCGAFRELAGRDPSVDAACRICRENIPLASPEYRKLFDEMVSGNALTGVVQPPLSRGGP